MKCPKCSKLNADSSVFCRHCGYSLEFPNVRAAKDPAEVQALTIRYLAVLDAAKSPEDRKRLNEFEAKVQLESRAVICRPLGKVNELLDSGHGLFQTFYYQVTLGRIPEANKYDKFRTSVDNLLFPYYHERIHFAALTLDETGPKSYGAGRSCIFLLKQTIQNRASVFEENLFLYCERTRHPATEDIPLGLRASWLDRHRLAVAKLGGSIVDNQTAPDFQSLLLQAGKTTGDDKFIEVHIHDPLTAEAVELAKLPSVRPAKVRSELTELMEKSEKILLEAVKMKLETLGVRCQVV